VNTEVTEAQQAQQEGPMIAEPAEPVAPAVSPAPGDPGTDSAVSIRQLSKSYPTPSGDRLVLDGIDLDVRRGRFVCVVGPSGAGKTTLLRCMAGLLKPTSGSVVVDGTAVERPPEQLSVVFQDYSRSLMPWMSVESNVVLPLRSRRMPKADRLLRAREALAAVGLTDSRDQYPWQLSGGMQQRAAIARALACRSQTLLMDEPFASVDAQTRADLEDLMLAVREQFGVTVVLVTHDIDEAVYLGDQVVVLSGSPTSVREVIEVDLGTRRDQLATKAMPEFAALRSHVLQLIRTKEGTA
jgi:NitT/TauT family transport system ATP-binding protein